MTEKKDLIPSEGITPEDVFSSGGSDVVLAEIEARAKALVPDTSSLRGRDAIKSMAAKVRSSKAFLDKMGKTLKDQYKVKIDPIDGERRKIRERLDALADEVRRPLTEYEEEKARIKAAEELKKHIEECHAAALEENELFNLRKEKMEREAAEQRAIEEAAAKKEAERKAKEEAEDRAAFEAEAKRKAEEAAAAEKEKAHREKVEAEKKAEALKDEMGRWRVSVMAGVGVSIEYESARNMHQTEFEEVYGKARVRHEEEQAKLVAKQEAKRLKDEADKKRSKEEVEAKAREADIKHRSTINNLALKAIAAIGVEESVAKNIVRAIAKGEIPNVSMRY